MPLRQDEAAEVTNTWSARVFHRAALGWGAVALAFVAGALAVLYLVTQPQQPAERKEETSVVVPSKARSSGSPELPVVDLEGVDPIIAQLIAGAREQVALRPDSGAAWGKLAVILDSNDFRGAADTCFAEASRLDPTNARWPYLHASSNLADSPERALPLLQRAVDLTGDEPMCVRLRLAELLIELGQLDDAENHLKRSLAYGPQDGRALLAMGRLSISRGSNMAECREYLEKSLQVKPTKQAHLLLASVLFRMDERQAAEDHQRLAVKYPNAEQWPDAFFQESAEFKVGLQSYLQSWSRLVGSKQFAEGAQLMQRATREYPNSKLAWATLGNSYVQLKNFAAARNAFERGLSLDGRPNVLLHSGLGGLLLGEGKYSDAITHLRTAVAMEPGDADIRNTLGFALSGQGQTAEALAEFREVLRLKPNFPGAHKNLGVALADLGQAAEAIAEYREELRVAPDQFEALNNLAWILAAHPDASLRDGVGAVQLAERACKLAPQPDPSLLDTLAVALAEAGRFAEAVQAAEQAAQLSRNSPNPQLIAEIESHLQLFRAGRPYQDRPSAASPPQQ